MTGAAFSELGAHPTIARALAVRGYEIPTPVQAAVLGVPDQDLLVSSQTGSGKTVAFGLLLARTLLGEAEQLPTATLPRALVVAPTRELAAQVKRELTWLFAGTGGRIAACTGGTDLRLDARALKRGVDVVVGTPGRLVDLIERKSLDLSATEVVVLDEADEMLDLGFRESLEVLLQAAPSERRTLLFSATLPPGIKALAKRYQKDALPLDPRVGAPTAHEDIQHVAHLCAEGERLAALVNVLRLADDERALVFCRTRENVAELHRLLGMRGFLATAISGERAQAERDQALEAMRQGRVRVLVATNVAARGLDLPDVGLVIHADLPENADALTHRSGRTGRAGRKGRNIFIVEKGVQRRAERLFSEAHLRLRWTAPPTREAVAARDRERLRTEVSEAAAVPASAELGALTAQILAEHDAAAVIAALLGRALCERPAGEVLTPVELAAKSVVKKGAPGPRAFEKPRVFDKPRAFAAPRAIATPRASSSGGEFVLFQVNLGADDNATANWILPLVCRRGAITRREVGAIRVAQDRTFIEVAERAAEEFSANVAEGDPRAPNVRIERAGDPLPARPTAPPPARPTAPRPGARRPAKLAAASHLSRAASDGRRPPTRMLPRS